MVRGGALVETMPFDQRAVFSNPVSGVQRLLDAWGQRGSWMPSKIFYIRPAKFLTTFLISWQISRKFAPWMPPRVLHHASVTTFFSSFFAIYLHFLLQKLAPWMPPGVDAPRGGCPGPPHRPHPPCTPLNLVLATT